MSYFDSYVEANKGNEGKLAVRPDGSDIPNSRYLGNGKYIVRKDDGDYVLYAINEFGGDANRVRLSKDAVDILGNLDI